MVPQPLEDEVLDLALLKVRGENAVRECIRAGQKLRELYDTYGVL